MANASFYSYCRASSDHYVVCTLSVSEVANSVDVSNNTSKVSYSVSAVKDPYYKFTGTTRSGAGTLKVIINGSTAKSLSVPLNSGVAAGTTIASSSGTVTVAHDDDGSKTCNFELKMETGTGADPNGANPPWFWQSKSSSNSITLTKINRYSTLTAFSSFTIEDGLSFSYTDYLANKTITAAIKITSPSNSNTVVTIKSPTYTSSVGTHTEQVTFTSSELSTIYSTIGTSKKSATFSIDLSTSGITTTSTKTATGSMDTAINKPVLSSGSMNETALAAYDVAPTEIIRYLSTKQIFITATAYNGASISKVEVKNGSTTATLTQASSPGVYVGTITNITNDTFSIVATDSRGLVSDTYTLRGTLKEYTMPRVTNVDFKRSDTSGNESTIYDSGFIKSKGTFWNGSAGSISNNTVTWTYAITGASNPSSSLPTPTAPHIVAHKWDGQVLLPTGTLLRDHAYTCTVTVTDSLGQSDSLSVELGTAELSMWLGKRTLRVEGIVAEHYIGVFPVGSIYMSVNNTNPSTYFGGTWVQIAKGRTLIGVGEIETNSVTTYGTVTASEFSPAAGEKGGEVGHTLTTAQLPAHSHTVNSNATFTVSNATTGGTGTSGIYGSNSGWGSYSPADWYRLSTADTGGGGAHNNIQPYLAVYIWQRTA